MTEIDPTEMTFVNCHYYRNPKAQPMGNIDWIPLADFPDSLKDGRWLLLGYPTGKTPAAIARWGLIGAFVDEHGSPDVAEGATHFAEINPPA